MRRSIVRGFRSAGELLFSFFAVTLVVYGALTISGRLQDGWVGWVALAVGALIVVLTVHRWINVLPGLLLLATLNAAISVFTGKALHSASPVPRSEALAATALFALATLISARYHKRRISRFHTVMFVLYFGCLVWSIVSASFLMPLLIGTGLLVGVWCLDYWGSRSANV